MASWTNYTPAPCHYSQDVANRFGRRVSHIVRSDDYARIMDTAIVADNHAVENSALENGSDTGGRCQRQVRADWVLIDDPVKGRESADSDLQRETIWTTLNDDVFTRMKPNAKIVIAMTRWHARVKSRLRSSRSISRGFSCRRTTAPHRASMP